MLVATPCCNGSCPACDFNSRVKPPEKTGDPQARTASGSRSMAVTLAKLSHSRRAYAAAPMARGEGPRTRFFSGLRGRYIRPGRGHARLHMRCKMHDRIGAGAASHSIQPPVELC